jgi:dephospho-CoA kinase
MFRVGLTGGIASGKSRVLERLAAAGLHTLDLDRVAHQVMAPGGSAYADVVAGFGAGILAADGAIDRKALGALVFADAGARARLNAIVHPRVREAERRLVESNPGAADAVFVSDAALLVEAGSHLRYDRLVVVHCAPEEQLRRLTAREAIDPAAARARIAAQMPAEEKRRFAHFEVETSGRIEDTDRAADRLAGELLRLASTRGPAAPVPLERAAGCLVHGPARGPRALDPEPFLREIAAAGVPEMERLARLLDPPAEGPWYRSARPGEGPPFPEALAGPLILWSLKRGAPDEELVAAAVFSLTRLTHSDGPTAARACLFGLALLAAAASGRVPPDLAQRQERWSAIAGRWAGAPPSPGLGPVFEAVLRHPRDVASARAACLDAGGDPDLAGALVGVAVGVAPGAVRTTLLRALETLRADA